MHPLLNTVVGSAPFGVDVTNPSVIHDRSVIQQYFDLLKENGFNQIDTARRYGASEEAIGLMDYAQQGIIVDTKIASFTPGDHSPDKIRESIKQSLQNLKTKKVHILYLHSPDRTVPLESTLQTINDIYKEGSFDKFGLSNYSAEEVELVVKICKEKNYVPPTAYQGNYNIFTRKNEDTLFPVLKREKISFYAYSPLAGGFINYQPESDKNPSRFEGESQGSKYYRGLYFKDSNFKALEKLNALSTKLGLTNSEIATRWLYFHSQLKREDGDSVIFGASARSGPAQFKSNLDDAKKGPLSPEAVQVLDEIWTDVKGEAPNYHF